MKHDKGIRKDIFELLTRNKNEIKDSAHPNNLISSLVQAYCHDRHCSAKMCDVFTKEWLKENDLEFEED